MRYLNLASGAAHFRSPEAALAKTVAALHQNETFYGEIAGLPALQKALARRYQEDYGAKVPEENILITAGTKQALFNLFSNLLQPGDEVILPKPSWFGFTGLFELLQVKTVFVETSLAENYALKPETLAAAITPKTKLFVYSNPGNPTGRLYSESEIKSWLEVLKNYPEITVLSDEIYDLILFDGLKLPSLLQFPDPQNKHVVVNGFSKNFGMSGWRIGYLVAPESIIQQAIDFQQTTISGVNPFIQEGAVAALETRKEFLPGRLQELNQNREMLCNWLTKNEAGYFKPQGAYYVFADLTNWLNREKLKQAGLFSTHQLCEHFQEYLKLEFQPGEKFNCPGFVRITFAVPEAELLEAFSRLEQFL